MVIRFGSLFSGAGGLDMGLEAAGLTCAWQIERDKQCRQVLARHWPDIPKFGDITEVDPEQLATVDLMAGGSPCQNLSVAGNRAGLAGDESRLFYEFVRLADSQPSAWILWENVPGALWSHGGRDFAIILRELSGFHPAVPADGWRSGGACIGAKRWLVWRVLDSQYFGVPQERHRVFIVAGPRAGTCAPEVLFEPESVFRDSPARRKEGEVASALLAGSPGGSRRIGAEEAAGEMIVAGSLRATDGGADAVTARAGHLVARTLRGAGCDASEDGAGRQSLIVVGSLTAHHGRNEPSNETFVVPYHLAQITHPENRANPQPGAPAPALNGDPRLAIAFQCHGSNVGPMGTLRTGHNAGCGVPFVASALDAQGTHAVAGHDDGGIVNPVLTLRGVRKLTPRECERLQGWADDWTRWGDDGRELADTPRYRMIGNGVTAPVAEWIGRRIKAAMEGDHS